MVDLHVFGNMQGYLHQEISMCEHYGLFCFNLLQAVSAWLTPAQPNSSHSWGDEHR